MKSWMIYGANGTMGRLIAAEARRRGYMPVLAGRADEALLNLADQYDLPYRVFSLTHQKVIRDQLQDVALVLNCAGPFAGTADALRTAALKLGCHYLDLSTEASVNRRAYADHECARASGSVILPAIGFDAVLTDSLVASLCDKLADIVRVTVDFNGPVSITAGQLKSSLREMWQEMVLPCDIMTQSALLACGHSSADIPLEIQRPLSTDQQRFLFWGRHLKPLLGIGLLRRGFDGLIDRHYKHCDSEPFRPVSITIRVYTQDSDEVASELSVTPCVAIEYTVISSLMAVEHVLADKIMPGVYTPAHALDGAAMMALNRHGDDDQAGLELLDINIDDLEH